VTLRRDPEKARLWRQRSQRIKPMSAKAQRFQAQFNLSKAAVAKRSGGFCEARTPACAVYATHFHHKAGRVGPGVNLPGMILHACDACHRQIHASPEESYRQGWMVKRLGRQA